MCIRQPWGKSGYPEIVLSVFWDSELISGRDVTDSKVDCKYIVKLKKFPFCEYLEQ